MSYNFIDLRVKRCLCAMKTYGEVDVDATNQKGRGFDTR
jgi:hypothetical protein